jgi:hypothetical protein
LALPTDSSDTFIREVEENYRRDQLENFAKRYGKWIALAAVLLLAAVGGLLYWQSQQQAKRADQSEELNRVYADIAAGRMQTVPQRLDQLEQSGSEVVRASALLTQAAVALERNDRAAAIASYRELSSDEDMSDVYRNVAAIRATALEFDQLKPEEVIARLQPLAQPGSPWFGSAGEMIALAYIRQGRNDQAGRLFAAIAADRQVPDTIRSRAVQIAGTLGVDASASLPALDQQDQAQ